MAAAESVDAMTYTAAVVPKYKSQEMLVFGVSAMSEVALAGETIEQQQHYVGKL